MARIEYEILLPRNRVGIDDVCVKVVFTRKGIEISALEMDEEFFSWTELDKIRKNLERKAEEYSH